MTDVRAPANLFELRPGDAAAPRRPARLTAANAALTALWRTGLATEPSLAPAAMMQAACRRTGLSAYGAGGPWRRNLDVLADALERDARLTPLGRVIAHGQIVSHLANRLRAVRLWRMHPEILERPVTAPIVVLGQMRSGTTRMQRLLACDPGFAHTRFYESWNPVPARGFDDRWLRGAMGLGVARLLNPGFAAIHPTAVGAPDEEIGLHGFSLFGSAFEAQWRVPSFVAHGEASDPKPVYAEFKRLLQTLAWLRGDDGTRPLILKVPQFTQDLPALLHIFPDARLIRLTRDRNALAASSASLVANQMKVQSDAVDAHWIGREWRRKIALREERMEAALATRCDVPVVEVAFEAMDLDWRREMRRVYALLGRPLDAKVERRMAAELAGSVRGPARRHRYVAANFGLA